MLRKAVLDNQNNKTTRNAPMFQEPSQDRSESDKFENLDEIEESLVDTGEDE